jgi:hypothetical protein
MNTNMSIPAPGAVLGFLAVFGGMILALLLAAVAMFSGKKKFAGTVAKVALAGEAIYLAVLLGFSFASQEKTLQKGEEKYFCEIDCHLAYSVQWAGYNGSALTVAVRTRFDERTISQQRGNGALTPNPRRIWLVDKAGRSHAVVSVQETSPATPLRPGESYVTLFTFEPVDEFSRTRLLISSDGWPEYFLIGGENSLLHKKTYLAL